MDGIIQDITRSITSTNNITQAYEEFANGIKNLVDYDWIDINIIDRDQGSFRVAYNQGEGPLGRGAGDVVQLVGSEVLDRVMSGRTVVGTGSDHKRNAHSLLHCGKLGPRSSIMVPLLSRGEVLGFMSLGSNKSDAYGPREQYILESLALAMAPTIDNSELFEKLQASVEELVVVDEVARIITSTLDIDEVFEEFASEMKKLVNFDRLNINIVDTKAETVTLRYLSGKPRHKHPLGDAIPLKGTQTERIVNLAEAEIWPDLALAPNFPGKQEFQEMGLRSSIALPLIANDRGIASLVLRSCQPNTYGTKERTILERLARQITPAILNAQMFDQTREAQAFQRRLAQENTALAEIGRIISSTLDVGQVYERFAEKVNEVIPFDRILVNTIDRDGGPLIKSYLSGMEVAGLHRDRYRSTSGSFAGEVIQSRSAQLVQGTDALEQAAGRLWSMKLTIDAGIQSFLGVPLISDDQVIGTLNLSSREPNRFTEQDVALAERIGLQITPAIVNSELYLRRQQAEEAERLRNEELGALFKIASIMSLPAEFEEKATQVLAELMEVVQADSAILRVPVDEGQSLKLVASAGINEAEFPVSPEIPCQGTLPGMAFEQGEPITVNDYAGHPQAGAMGIKRGHKSMTSLPIQAGGSTLGVVIVLSKSSGHFTTERVKLLTAIGDGLGMLLDNARLSQDLLGRNKEMAVVDEVARIITSTLEIDEVYEKFAGEVRKLVDFDRMNISIINRPAGVLRVRNVVGDMRPGRSIGDAVPLEGSKSGYVMHSGCTLVQPDLSQEQRFQSDNDLYKIGFRSGIVVPLFSKDQVIGTLSLRSRKLSAYGSREQAVLERLAKQIAPAVDNARLYEESRNEEKRATNALAQLKALLSSVDAGILLVNDAREVLWMNQKLGDFFGFDDVETLTDGHTSQAERRRELESRLAYPEQVFTQNDRVYVNQKYDGPSDEIEVLYPRRRILQPFTTPVYDQEGGYIGRLWVYHDVTERRQAEDQLRKLSCAVEQSPNSVMITDTEGKIEYVNSTFVSLTGYKLEEVIGKQPSLLSSGETSVEEYRQMWQSINSGREWRGQLHNRKKNGELYWSDLAISGIKDLKGEITHFLALDEDVTERKRLEEQFMQSQKMESVGRLAGGVAHDFNNLLTAIIGYSQLAMAGANPNSNLFSQINEIQSAAERAANLTNQLLAFSRSQVIAPKAVNLNDLITNMDKMLRRLIGEDIELIALQAANLELVKVDPGQIDQVLMNLAVNARDAMPDGGRLTIETRNLDVNENASQQNPGIKPGRYVLLSVSDTGTGMSKEVRDQIFVPFFTTKEVGKGTGLGLSTCYGVIQQSGGHIEVYGQPGEGTTFMIYLPVTADELRPERKADGQDVLPQGRETVLLAEDEPLVRGMVATVLRDQGYEVLEARDGEEALKVARNQSGREIHLLVTDVVMPIINGPELAERLRTTHPDVKILFTSGYVENSLHYMTNLDPAVAFLSKPYKPGNLATKVRETLDA